MHHSQKRHLWPPSNLRHSPASICSLSSSLLSRACNPSTQFPSRILLYWCGQRKALLCSIEIFVWFTIIAISPLHFFRSISLSNICKIGANTSSSREDQSLLWLSVAEDWIGGGEEEAVVVGPFDFFRRRLIYPFRRSIWVGVLATTNARRPMPSPIVDCRRTIRILIVARWREATKYGVRYLS